MATAEQWLEKLSHLSTNKHGGDPAPHKPLLLLVVLELAEQGLLPDKELPLTPDLAFRFSAYSWLVAHRRTQKLDVRYPFHHLHKDGVWKALGEDGKPSPHRLLTRCAELNPDFVTLAKDPDYREQARRILIAKYFRPDERIALYTTFGLPVPDDGQIAQDAAFRSPDKARARGRGVRFRVNVVAAYKYTCALTGYRLTTVGGASIVDAAHIHQFADSRNDNPRNGVALSKNAHWLFDNGLWTLTDEYTVVVAGERFAEHSGDQRSLSSYQGQRIQLPENPALRPDPIHLAWHRRKHGFEKK